MPSPHISIIIPTWNRSHTLRRTIESVRAQTISDVEILVCDDGSTDDSEIVIRSFGDERIRWLRGEHAGLPAVARNRGLKECKGKWIAFLDSDDEWLPEKLERQLEILEKQGVKACSTNASRIISGGKNTGEFLVWGCDRLTFNDILPVNRIITSSTIIHHSLIDRAQGFPEEQNLQALEDYALWLRIATMTDIAFIGDCLTHYYDNPSESIRVKSLHIWAQRTIVFTNFLRWADDTSCPPLYSRLAKKELSRARRKSFENYIRSTLTFFKKNFSQ